MKKIKTRHVYNLKSDPVDHRDYVMVEPPRLGPLPLSVDLRAGMPPVYDQTQLGSCTAQALAAALDYAHKKSTGKDFFNPSRLFIYYNERMMEGNPGEDSGACLRDGIKSVNEQGACAETTWPYVISQFALKPPPAAYTEAENFQAVSYQRVPLFPTMIKSVLASGTPFVVGITVYESFESTEVASTGIVPMPDTQREKCLGKHAVICCGYDDTKQLFLFRNSWGTAWGQSGNFWLPYQFVVNPGLTADAWAINQAE